MSLTIRRYARSDRDAVRDLMGAALRDADAYFPEAPALQDDDVLSEYVQSGGDFLVGERKGRVVATAAFRPPTGLVADRLDVAGRTAEVKRMHVHPDHQRQGVGQQMYDELEARARSAGYNPLFLATTGRQTVAHAFYEENGFEHVDATTEDVDGTTLEIRLFEKSLG